MNTNQVLKNFEEGMLDISSILKILTANKKNLLFLVLESEKGIVETDKAEVEEELNRLTAILFQPFLRSLEKSIQLYKENPAGLEFKETKQTDEELEIDNPKNFLDIANYLMELAAVFYSDLFVEIEEVINKFQRSKNLNETETRDLELLEDMSDFCEAFSYCLSTLVNDLEMILEDFEENFTFNSEEEEEEEEEDKEGE